MPRPLQNGGLLLHRPPPAQSEAQLLAVVQEARQGQALAQAQLGVEYEADAMLADETDDLDQYDY